MTENKKPLSSITDEEAISIFHLCHPDWQRDRESFADYGGDTSPPIVKRVSGKLPRIDIESPIGDVGISLDYAGVYSFVCYRDGSSIPLDVFSALSKYHNDLGDNIKS